MFVSLNGAPTIARAFVLGYRFTDDAGELWTQRFNAFKAGEERAVLAGIATMRIALTSIAVPSERTVIIGVPGSAETQLSPGRPVARFAKSIAAQWGAGLDLTLLKKDVHEPLHSKGSASARQETLSTANYRTTHKYIDVKNYVIVDDFVTRGDTMQKIATVISSDAPGATFIAIALAKTDRLMYYWSRGKQPPDNKAAAAYEAVWIEAQKAK